MNPSATVTRKGVNKVNFGTVKRILLIGGARLLAETASALTKEKNYQVVVFSSVRHLEESVSGYDSSLKKILEKNKIQYFCEEDINQSKEISRFLDGDTLAMAMGAAWVFEKSFVKKLAKPFLDFMGIDLPRYRGGGHYTWQILFNNRKGCCNLQVISGGEETFHQGAIIKRKEYRLAESCRQPVDYFNAAVKVEKDFIFEFLKEIEEGKDFDLMPLNEEESTYYPFLSTPHNGWINWDWDVQAIEKFICAFDDPYLGASTRLNGKRVFVKKCRIEKVDADIHPFAAGLVIFVAAGFIRVMVKGGVLRIEKIYSEKQKDVLKEVRKGDRLWSTAEDIDRAFTFQAQYGARGLKK